MLHHATPGQLCSDHLTVVRERASESLLTMSCPLGVSTCPPHNTKALLTGRANAWTAPAKRLTADTKDLELRAGTGFLTN